MNEVVPSLMEILGIGNIHEVPRIEKITINSCVDSGDAKARLQIVEQDIIKITGQKPSRRRARKSISNFKLREGMDIGVKVTLRGPRMYDFLTRLVSIALPSIRDFRGLMNKFDGRGNITIGIEDHTIFPEVVVEASTQRFGMDVTITTTANDDQSAYALLTKLGFPFRRKMNAEASESTK